MKKAFLISALVFSLVLPVSAATTTSSSTTPEEYQPHEFPQWAHDLRRTEIIAFGSLPFVTMGVSLLYSTYLFYTGEESSFLNPLTIADSFSSDQQINILKISVGVSAVLGLVDLGITVLRRSSINYRLMKKQKNVSHPSVSPIAPGELIPYPGDESLNEEKESPEFTETNSGNDDVFEIEAEYETEVVEE